MSINWLWMALLADDKKRNEKWHNDILRSFDCLDFYVLTFNLCENN